MSKSFLLLLFAIIVGGLFQNHAKIERWFKPPLFTKGAGNNKVILYSTTWCGYCAKTREFFADNNINYTDLDVENSEIGRKEYQRLGANGVPIVVINNSIVIHGYAPDQIVTALMGTHPKK